MGLARLSSKCTALSFSFMSYKKIAKSEKCLSARLAQKQSVSPMSCVCTMDKEPRGDMCTGAMAEITYQSANAALLNQLWSISAPPNKSN